MKTRLTITRQQGSRMTIPLDLSDEFFFETDFEVIPPHSVADNMNAAKKFIREEQQKLFDDEETAPIQEDA